MITVATITDAQIDGLWRAACGTGSHHDADPDTMHLCTVATNRFGDFESHKQHEARGRCAEILNARRHTTWIDTEARGEQVGNSELHLFHRWSCTCGAVGAWGHSLWAATSIGSARSAADRHIEKARGRGELES